MAKATVTKTPAIAKGSRNLLGKGEAEGELVADSAEFDDKFPAGVGGVGSTATRRVECCSTVFCPEDATVG
jgi:hypothetical protein